MESALLASLSFNQLKPVCFLLVHRVHMLYGLTAQCSQQSLVWKGLNQKFFLENPKLPVTKEFSIT